MAPASPHSTISPSIRTVSPTQDTAADPAHKDSFAGLIVSAVREQLGLRLEKQKTSLAITIVDRAEHPSAN